MKNQNQCPSQAVLARTLVLSGSVWYVVVLGYWFYLVLSGTWMFLGHWFYLEVVVPLARTGWFSLVWGCTG